MPMKVSPVPDPAHARSGTGLTWRRISAAVGGAAALHLALAGAVNGVDTAGIPHLKARSPALSSVQVRTIAAVVATAPLAVPSPSGESPSPGAGAPLPPDATPEPSQRYFDTSEVDAPAMPLPEWQVDVPMLMAQGVRSVSVDVLISQSGVAQQCAVTRIEPQQPPALQLAVASRLCETVLRPAQRRGVAVASVRHIELVLAAD